MAFGRAGGRVYCTNSLGYDKDSRVYPPLPRIRPGGGGGGQKREMGGVGRTRCTKMKESRKEGGGREREGCLVVDVGKCSLHDFRCLY